MSGIDFSGVTLPFSVGELVSSGNALLGIVGTFVMLGLAFRFVPKLIALIGQAFKGGAGGKA